MGKKIIELKNLSKNFGDNQVLKGIDLNIYENEFLTLLGPSGCGKTTILRIIAGFEEPSHGQVMFNGEDIAKVPAYKREVNTVFQKYALFPFLNVHDNVAFGLNLKKKDKKDEQIEELNDRLKRQMAEFENFRKRSEKEKSQMFDMGAKTIVEKILPVIDNFERGLAAVPDDKKDDPFITGMDKVYKQMLTELDAAGVKPIECVGQEFDPDFHNAVMQVENDELESGTVAQELQKGYMYKDSVVRHSMVSVVQ